MEVNNNMEKNKGVTMTTNNDNNVVDVQGSTDRIALTDEESENLQMSDLRKDLECPICLHIIRNTRTMECLHRFCKACIEKAMRMGNNECPVCRKHCASRRSFRDDPNIDTIISILIPDIDKYEKEELAFQEEDKARLKKTQASIAETVKRQFGAGSRKRSTRSKRLRKKYEEDGNVDEDKDSSSSDELPAKTTRKRERKSSRFAACSSYSDTFSVSDVLTWGIDGIRSHPQPGCIGIGNCLKSRLVVAIPEDNNTEPKMSIIVVSLNEQEIPSLKEPYICCRPTTSVEKLCKYLSEKIGVCKDAFELFIVTEIHSEADVAASSSNVENSDHLIKIDESRDKLRALEEHETMGALNMNNICYKDQVIIGYKKKSESV
ncbi:hypothetical protein ACFE04_002898 [Oxalis oulophora]